MAGMSFPRRALLLGLVIVFTLAALVFSIVWMHHVRWQASARLCMDYDYSPLDRHMVITSVCEDGAAARAGLRPGDAILALNRRPLDDLTPLFDEVLLRQPGEQVVLSVRRAGENSAVVITAILQEGERDEPSMVQRLASELVQAFPVLFLLVGLPVLFLRWQDRSAWLLAIILASFIANVPLIPIEPLIGRGLRGFAVAFQAGFGYPSPALFYFFTAVFPAASPLEKRLPWLKWAFLIPTLVLGLAMAIWALIADGAYPVYWLDRAFTRVPLLGYAWIAYSFGVYGLGLVSMVWNMLTAPSREARRKSRVMVWGTVAGLTPFLLLQVAAVSFGHSFYYFPFWIWAPCVLLVFLVPLAFAYAVVKHRVLEIPVLLRRSARYFMVQRGFTMILILLCAAIMILATRSLASLWHSAPAAELRPDMSVITSLAAGLLGVGLFWAGSGIRSRVTRRIDRAFFRSAYDARQILEDLVEKSRTAASRQELVTLLHDNLDVALQPSSLLVYLKNEAGDFVVEVGEAAPGRQTLAASLPLLTELAQHESPRELYSAEDLTDSSSALLTELAADCLVPIKGRVCGLEGLLVLGPRLSEEPYSREDQRMLASVANQSGLTLESFALATGMARRMEAERRAAHELEIAHQVQRKLFPQRIIPLSTLDYVADCIQARAVGGDYYDFLDLGDGHVGLILADISGKGMSAALLMANLQATLRSRAAQARSDLARTLRSVNEALLESTEPTQFATLFFADYDDKTRRLRYANCGHNPPLVLRTSGRIERLDATATVLGAFADWECPVAAVVLAPGDMLVVYSDGVTEAEGAGEGHFGEQRLIRILRGHQQRTAGRLLDSVIKQVQQHCGAHLSDDLTLLVAQAR